MTRRCGRRRREGGGAWEAGIGDLPSLEEEMWPPRPRGGRRGIGTVGNPLDRNPYRKSQT